MKATVDGLLDLLSPAPLRKLGADAPPDRAGRGPEQLYLGPDENITPADIDWIAHRAAARGYARPAAFISSKPATGINHKEFGVTSEGVAGLPFHLTPSPPSLSLLPYRNYVHTHTHPKPAHTPSHPLTPPHTPSHRITPHHTPHTPPHPLTRTSSNPLTRTSFIPPSTPHTTPRHLTPPHSHPLYTPSVFLEVALQGIGINPRAERWTAKLTGGPDGDVAGNMLNILHREYGEHVAVVGMADGSGCAEDPAGLPMPELLRLFKARHGDDCYL